MQNNKRVIIFITIALILAITAITLNATDSDKVLTTRESIKEEAQGGQLGIEIQPFPVEDKLLEETPQQ